MAWTLTNTIFSGIHVIKPGDLCADEQPLLNLSALKHHELVRFLADWIVNGSSSSALPWRGGYFGSATKPGTPSL